MNGDRWNKTHCDKCKSIVVKGEGIYAEGGFFHSKTCYEEVKQSYIDSYEWEEDKTFCEEHATCPYCGYVDEDSFELVGDDGTDTCGRCGKEYDFTRDVTVTYSTTPKEEPK